MHEISIARNIIDTLEAEYSEMDLIHLNAIDLRIGRLSNVEPQLMKNAFKAVTAVEQKYQSVNLSIEVVPIEIYCADCNKNVTIENYKFICPCGKPSNNVIKGMELFIHKLHFDE